MITDGSIGMDGRLSDKKSVNWTGGVEEDPLLALASSVSAAVLMLESGELKILEESQVWNHGTPLGYLGSTKRKVCRRTFADITRILVKRYSRITLSFKFISASISAISFSV